MSPEYFLLAGAQRSGTTFLYELLDRHPDIEMARPVRPEPKYFLHSDVASRGGASDYRALFREKPGARVFGEKSTSYMERADIAQTVLSVLGDVKVIFLLRDPIERAISNYRFSVEAGIETSSLENAILHEEARRENYDRTKSSVSPFAYSARGRYCELIQRWEAAVGLERIQIVVFEHLIADPRSLESLYLWLGVRPFDPEMPSCPVNASTVPADVSPAIRRYLSAQFQESNRMLQERYGVDVSLWQSPTTNR